MPRINVPAEVQTLANSLALLGNDAQRTCAGFSTRPVLERLLRDLGTGKGGIMKLRRSIRALLAEEAAEAREEARIAAAYARDEERLTAAREAQASGERMAAAMGMEARAA